MTIHNIIFVLIIVSAFLFALHIIWYRPRCAICGHRMVNVWTIGKPRVECDNDDCEASMM